MEQDCCLALPVLGRYIEARKEETMNVGTSLQQARITHGYTQEAIARHLYVTRQTVSRWEHNQTMPNVYVLRELSDLYGLPMDHLVSGESWDSPQPKEDTLIMKDRSMNPFALLGVVVWNSIFFISIALGILGILLATWIITVSCLFAPVVLLIANILGQPWDWWQTAGSLGLCLMGVSVFPLVIMMSRAMVRTTRLYYRYNHKALYD